MKHSFTQRIIYRDTDAEGVVYYANYLAFFERGRTEFFTQLGVSLRKLKEEQDLVFAITDVECHYKAPARYEDDVTVTTEIADVTKTRIAFRQEVLRGTTLLVTARISACAIKLATFKPGPIPEQVAALLNH